MRFGLWVFVRLGDKQQGRSAVVPLSSFLNLQMKRCFAPGARQLSYQIGAAVCPAKETAGSQSRERHYRIISRTARRPGFHPTPYMALYGPLIEHLGVGLLSPARIISCGMSPKRKNGDLCVGGAKRGQCYKISV